MAKRFVTKILASLSTFLAIPLMKEILIFVLSMSPILELRGGLIAASLLHMNPIESYIICVIGNILPIPLILLFFDRVLEWMRKGKKLKKIAKKIEEIRKMSIVQYLRYYLEKEEIERKKNKNQLIPEEENEEEEKEENEIKLAKNKKVKKEEDEENFDEETRAEIDNEMKPVLELKELLKANEKIKYDFIL